MSLKIVIPRQSGRLAALLIPSGELWEQVLDPTDYRGERLTWAKVDTSSLPKHLLIVSAQEQQNQRLIVQLEDGSLWQQVRDKEEMSAVKYRFEPVSLDGLPTPENLDGLPKMAKPPVRLRKHYN